ncbi:PfkB family carbohydrate kinase [Virgibacillus halophilus]|uniref:PfkB family carbohydrate kinase n=1 Tax=Tigheibacillus halophilus TaxID=361280 RepID=UPI0036F37D2D
MSSIITLGEIMARFSTDKGTPLSQANQLLVHYGGSEANVAVSLANFGHDVSFASFLPENPLGLGAKRYIESFGVSTRMVTFRGERLGTYYLETGAGVRKPNVVYDRAHSSFSTAKELPWSFDELFEGRDLFHITGITTALSQNWLSLVVTLLEEAKKRNVTTSFDINYRTKLWSQEECGNALKKILPYIDILSAGILDAKYLMGIELQEYTLENVYAEILKGYPNIEVIYSTNRTVYTSEHNSLVGNIYRKGRLTTSKLFDIPNIIDRVGGGDAFTAGVLHKYVTAQDEDDIELINFATAASVLKHTISGDMSLFSFREVEEFVKHTSNEISR